MWTLLGMLLALYALAFIGFPLARRLVRGVFSSAITAPATTPAASTATTITPPAASTPSTTTPSSSTLVPAPPTAKLFPPEDGLGPIVPLVFLLFDDNNDPLDVDVAFDDGTGPRAATRAAGSDPVTRLPAPSCGTDHRILWDAGSDLGANVSRQVTVQVTPKKAGVVGQSTAATFLVDTTPIARARGNVTTDIAVGTFAIDSGNHQKVLAGQLCRDALTVVVKDASGSPLRGARVLFKVSSTSGRDVAIEDDFTYATTTGSDGKAAVRVRPARAASAGSFQVKATVLGVFGQDQTFDLEVVVPAIISDPLPTSALLGGDAYTLSFFYDGDNDSSTVEMAPHELRPVVLEVSGTDCELLDRRLVVASNNIVTVTFVPTKPAGSVTLTLEESANPATQFAHTFAVATQSNATRATSFHPTYQTAPVTFHLELVEGLDPATHNQQRAYPGLTLATGFRVKLVDDNGQEYTQRVTTGGFGCGPLGQEELKVDWYAGSGLLSLQSPAPAGATGAMTAKVSERVYFTPRGPGPWTLRAQVADTVLDRFAVPEQHWTDASGHAQCGRQSGIDVNVTRTVCVQLPELRLEDTSTGNAIDTLLAPGTNARLLVKGLSPISGGKPEDAQLACVQYSGSPYPTYSGQVAAPFRQPVAMALALPSDVHAEKEILFLQGDPSNYPTASLLHMINPSSVLRVDAAGIHLAVATKRRAWRRKNVDAGFPFHESSAGTSPFDGFDGTIQLASGELVRTVTDLSFRTRSGNIILARTARSALAGEGMFGPTWFGLFEASLDLSAPLLMRLVDGVGRVFDIPDRQLPDCLYSELNFSLQIDADHGAWELVDRVRTHTHYNIDGSLRFIEDRNKNRTRFTYDVQGRLHEVIDPLGRSCRFDYFPGNVVKTLTDFGGRSVTFEYYGVNDPDGNAGLLKKVTRPTAPTMIGGTEQASYARSETYKYFVGGALDNAPKEILDSELRSAVAITYTPERRVETQTYGAGVLRVDYTAASRTVQVTDRGSSVRTWTFKASPLADAATPIEAVEKGAAGGTRSGDLTTTMKHNVSGELVSVTFPGGGSRTYIYDDGSQYPRSRGNLLEAIETSPQGNSRHVTWKYRNDFNVIEREYHWEGWQRGMPGYLGTRYTYDASGNLQRIVNARTLFGTLVINAAGHDEIDWVHDNHVYALAYNNYGLVTSLTDPQGVVTTYEYYSDQAPSGAIGAATDPAFGGFLGKVTRDEVGSPRRDIYFPQFPQLPLTYKLAYDARGDVSNVVEPRAVKHTITCNQLRQVVTAARGDGSGMPIVEHFRYDSNGHLVRRELEQPSAGALAGAVVKADIVRNGDGWPAETQVDRDSTGARIGQKVSRTPEGLIEAIYPETVAGTTPADSLLAITRDATGLPYQQTFHPGTDPVQYAFAVDNNDVTTGITGPAGTALTLHVDDNADLDAITDASGIAITSLLDGTGRPDRIALQDTSGANPAVIGFDEIVHNELGIVHRVHRSLTALDLAAPSGSYPILESSEGFATGGTWPLVTSSALEDAGQWCRGDGRTSREMLSDPFGRLVRYVDDENRTVHLVRDPHGELVRAFDVPDGSYAVRRHTDANGDVDRIEVDELSTDPLRPAPRTLSWGAGRDDHGLVVRVSDALGNTVRGEYDESGFVKTATDAMAPDSTDPNDVFNNHTMNAKGNRTNYIRDAIGDVRRFEIELTTDGMGGSPKLVTNYNFDGLVSRDFTYDEEGRLLTVKDHENIVSQWNYDYARGGRLHELIHGKGTQWEAKTTYEYDSLGRLQYWTDPNGTKVKLDYDTANRVQKMSAVQLGSGVVGVDGYTFEYDLLDRVKTATEINRSLIAAFRWDFSGNLLEETQHGLLVSSRHDGAHKRKQLTYPSGSVIDVVRDTSGRVRKLHLGGADFIRYEYIGRKSLLGRVAGPAALQFEYDGAGRLLHQTHVNGVDFTVVPRRDGRAQSWQRTAGSVIETRAWQYDSACRIVKETSTVAGRSTVIERQFDGDGVLMEETVTDTVAGTSTSTLFWRAERGRIYKAKTGSTTTTYQYDKNGNLVNDGRFLYFYDFLDRLQNVKDTTNPANETWYDYDAIGRCTAMRRGNTVEKYIYDGWHLIEIRVDGKEPDRYYWGRATNELVAADIGGQRYYFVQAPDGSIDSVVDASGAVVETYRYSLNGRMEVLDAKRNPRAGAPLSRFGLHGHFYDSVLALIDVRHRRFHTGLGQFLTADPTGMVASCNMYAMSNHDPINVIDRFGYQEDGIDWAEAGGEFLKPVGIVAAAGLAAGLFPVLAPYIVAVGLGLLAMGFTVSVMNRFQAGQTMLESLRGGVLDTLGVSGILAGLRGIDVVTGDDLGLTPQQRGKALGGGLGSLIALAFGGRLFRGGASAGSWARGRYNAWRNPFPRTAFVVKPRAVPLRGISRDLLSDAGGQFPRACGVEVVEVGGHAHTLDDGIDMLVLRRLSMPRRGQWTGEAACIRLTTTNAHRPGMPGGSDLVIYTPPGSGEIAEVPEAVMNRLLEAVTCGRARSPRGVRWNAENPRVARLFHDHSGIGLRPGWGVPNHSPGDLLFLQDNLLVEPMRGRLAQDFQSIIVQIGSDGAPELLSSLHLSAATIPRPLASTSRPPWFTIADFGPRFGPFAPNQRRRR